MNMVESNVIESRNTHDNDLYMVRSGQHAINREKPNSIMIRFCSDKGNNIYVKMFRHDNFTRAFKVVSSRLGQSISNVNFKFNDRFLLNTDTPNTIGLNSFDVIKIES